MLIECKDTEKGCLNGPKFFPATPFCSPMISLRIWGRSLSGPPAEPAGKVFMAKSTACSSICNGSEVALGRSAQGKVQLGCFSFNFATFSLVGSAIDSLPDAIRIAPFTHHLQVCC